MKSMAKKPPKPKPTDAERHALFVETAREVEASEEPKDFDAAFGRVVGKGAPSKHHPSRG
jgi:hypothetical protein